MAVQIFNEGLPALFAAMVGGTVPPNLTVYLFTAPTALSYSTVYADFVGAVDPGAGPFALTESNWTEGGTGPGQIEWQYSPISMIFGVGSPPAETYYGYFVYDSSLDVAYWGELFTAPIPNTLGTGLILELFIQFGAP